MYKSSFPFSFCFVTAWFLFSLNALCWWHKWIFAGHLSSDALWKSFFSLFIRNKSKANGMSFHLETTGNNKLWNISCDLQLKPGIPSVVIKPELQRYHFSVDGKWNRCWSKNYGPRTIVLPLELSFSTLAMLLPAHPTPAAIRRTAAEEVQSKQGTHSRKL